MSKIDRTIVQEFNLVTFVSKIVELVKDGWEVDESNPPTQFAWMYETHLTRPARETDPEKVAQRAAILEKARAAKVRKAEQAAESVPEVVQE